MGAGGLGTAACCSGSSKGISVCSASTKTGGTTSKSVACDCPTTGCTKIEAARTTTATRLNFMEPPRVRTDLERRDARCQPNQIGAAKETFAISCRKCGGYLRFQLGVMELLSSIRYPDEGNSLHLTGAASTFDS